MDFIQFLTEIKNYDRIPKLPRQLASDYEQSDITPQIRLIMARLGTRDPNGVKIAMKRFKVTSYDELLALLEHQYPKRNIMQRLYEMLGRAFGQYGYDPHARAIVLDRRQAKLNAENKETHDRLKEAIRIFNDR